MIIYGVKTISLDDIVNGSYVGRPKEVCDYLKKIISRDPKYIKNFGCKVTLDTSLQGNFTIHNIEKPYSFVFSPIDYVEYKIMSLGTMEYFETIKKKMVLRSSVNEIERTIWKYEEKDYDFGTKYYNSDVILTCDCYMFVLNDEKVVDVFSAKPIYIIEDILLKDKEYECTECKKKMHFENSSINDYPPDIMYEFDNEIKYYCKACSRSRHGLKHVGEPL